MFRSWVLSTKAWILDSTVCFICCIISAGLKDELDPVCVDGGAAGTSGSDGLEVLTVESVEWMLCMRLWGGLMERDKLLKMLNMGTELVKRAVG